MTMRRSSLLVALLCVLGLVASGCGDDDEGSGGDSTTTAAESSDDAGDEGGGGETLTASAEGVNEDTITVGISMLDFPKLISAGLSKSGWGDQQLIWETLIQDLNDRGGINGRMVEAEYQYYVPINQVEMDAACLRFTEDIDAFAVLGGFLGPLDATNVCVAEDPDTALVMGSTLTYPRLAKAQAPWLTTGASYDRTLDNLILLLNENGDLEGKKIAVVGGNQAVDLYGRTGEVLAEYGVEPVLEVQNTAKNGDIPAGEAEWSVIAEQISTSEADTVLLVGSLTAGIKGIADNALDVDIWTPDAGELASLGASVTPEDADGTVTAGGLTAMEGWNDPLSEECRERFSALQPDIELVSPD
jgi:hypothetical protein